MAQKQAVTPQESEKLLESLGLAADEIVLTARLEPRLLPHEIVVRTWRSVLNKCAVENVLGGLGLPVKSAPSSRVQHPVGQVREDNRHLRDSIRRALDVLDAPVRLAVSDRTKTLKDIAQAEAEAVTEAKQILVSALAGL